MRDILREIAEIYENGREAVLVTLCATGGSTPGKAGAKLLVYPDGTTLGTIGGGSLEHEALRLATEVFRSKRPLLWENPLSAIHMKCGGAGTLFLEYLGGLPS